MSEEESLLLDLRVALSGLTKQDYITCKLLDKDVIVQGNPRVYKALKKQMEEILQELKRLKTAGEADEEFLQVIISSVHKGFLL